MPRVRQLRADQEGRLRLLQRLRVGGGVRVGSHTIHALKGLHGTPTAVTMLAEHAPKKKAGTYGRGVMSVIAFKEKSRGLAEQNRWPNISPKGYADCEAFRKRRKQPPLTSPV